MNIMWRKITSHAQCILNYWLQTYIAKWNTSILCDILQHDRKCTVLWASGHNGPTQPLMAFTFFCNILSTLLCSAIVLCMNH